MTDLSRIYKRLHETRDDHNDLARRARTYQAALSEMLSAMSDIMPFAYDYSSETLASIYKIKPGNVCDDIPYKSDEIIVKLARADVAIKAAKRILHANTPARQDQQPSE